MSFFCSVWSLLILKVCMLAVTNSVMQFIMSNVFQFSSGSLYISYVFNPEIASARILFLSLMWTDIRLLSDNYIDQLLSLFTFMTKNGSEGLWSQCSMPCSPLVNWTPEQNGKLQKLPSLLQIIFAACKRESLSYKLWAPDHQDHQLPEWECQRRHSYLHL